MIMNRSSEILNPNFVFNFLSWKFQNQPTYFVDRSFNLIIGGPAGEEIINLIEDIIYQFNTLNSVAGLFHNSGLVLR